MPPVLQLHTRSDAAGWFAFDRALEDRGGGPNLMVGDCDGPPSWSAGPYLPLVESFLDGEVITMRRAHQIEGTVRDQLGVPVPGTCVFGRPVGLDGRFSMELDGPWHLPFTPPWTFQAQWCDELLPPLESTSITIHPEWDTSSVVELVVRVAGT